MGTQLYLAGRPWRFAGFNLFQANMSAPIANCSAWAPNGTLDSQLALMGSGHAVVRAWFFQRMATTNAQRDWSTFDHALAVAKAHGLKMIATLADQWNYCEGPYKDETWYRDGYKTSILPGDDVPYRRWVEQVVSRYRNDPTIAIWELANEPEVQTSATNATCPADAESVMYSWARDISTLIKSIDPNHLVSLGTGGNGNCGLKGADYATVYSLPTLDVCSYHDYWGPTVALDSDPYNGIQLRINQCRALSKPIYAGEVGISIQSTTSLAERAADFAAKAQAQFAAGVDGFLAWNWWASSTRDFQIGPPDPALAAIAVR